MADSHYAVLGAEIPNNESRSGEVDLGEHNLVALWMPAGWAGTAITFQSKDHRQPEAGDVSVDDLETWKDVYDDAGTEVSITVAANRVVVIGTVTKAAIGALRYLRVRSGTAAAPVNQSPTRVVKLIVKRSG